MTPALREAACRRWQLSCGNTNQIFRELGKDLREYVIFKSWPLLYLSWWQASLLVLPDWWLVSEGGRLGQSLNRDSVAFAWQQRVKRLSSQACGMRLGCHKVNAFRA
jgi:hypothetical protein